MTERTTAREGQSLHFKLVCGGGRPLLGAVDGNVLLRGLQVGKARRRTLPDGPAANDTGPPADSGADAAAGEPVEPSA